MNAKLIATVILGLTALGSVSLAQAAQSEAAEACKDDVVKLCPGVKPGEGRIKACLKEHKSEVSAGCKKTVVKQRRSKRHGDNSESDNGADQ